ncbi:GNAT family N-acetyltransferase [Furfurilactobacillus siliginis]|uniref:N-acetyltransferase n=1 Tax=Furfurilactobacillus siliginis TaxID=348151 RepID=A0A0R2LG19_9LACO|nr:GNAT family N-acetyltransferase [Furfurilactobacillus siliginis]KRN96980.1 hypothetical protein IV55_GL000856 [Furfurilactobacillus siliginis]GEK27739.1 N-acetyltransferase [Furfurilactobacillus siliginis]
MRIEIRPFKPQDATAIAALITDNLLHINVRDYDLATMQSMAAQYTPATVQQMASYAHTYVAVDATGQLLATGSIANYWNVSHEAILLCVFVQPALQHQHLGQQIMQQLMIDPIYQRSKRIEIPASKTAVPFYQKFGFTFKDGQRALDDEGHVRLELFR